MSDIAHPLAVIVMGDPKTRLGDFVERNLSAANVVGHFVDSTENFLRLESEVDASRMILIDPDWELMLMLHCPGARLLVVQPRGDYWTPSWTDAAAFEVRSPYLDDELFQRYVLSWLREG